MHVRHPLWLQTAQQRPGAKVFATLFAVESCARALLSTVITVQALHLLGNARDVSLLFAMVGVVGLVASFSIPRLIRRLSRRRVYTLGALMILGAAVAFATVDIVGQVVGMLLRVYGVACLNITLSLYILQYIRRVEFADCESRRMQYSAIAWVAGPALGVFLYQQFATVVPFVVSGAMSLLLLAVFWILRLSEQPAIAAPTGRSRRGPLRVIGRFIAQPRLRLSWTIVFTRSWWWVFFFIYTPVYAVQQGLGELAGALVISAGNALLFLAPWFAGFARRHGVRAVLRCGYLLCGVFTLVAAALFQTPALALAALVAATIGTVMLDAVGNVAFLAAVRPREREEMTTVFRTYLDAAELLPPALFALVLSFFDLQVIYFLQGLVMLGMLGLLGYLPASLGKTRIRLAPEGELPGGEAVSPDPVASPIPAPSET
ncbi:MAG: MFS transporter [Gammaproteobacteria bacterium]